MSKALDLAGVKSVFIPTDFEWGKTTPTGMEFTRKENDEFEPVPLEDGARAFNTLVERISSDSWAIGDLYIRIEKDHGSLAAQMICTRTMSESRLLTIVGVCKKFSGDYFHHRRPCHRLSFTHHEKVRFLIGNPHSPEWEKEAWLLLAKYERTGESADRLEEEVNRIKGIDTNDTLTDGQMKGLPFLNRILFLQRGSRALIEDLPQGWSEAKGYLTTAEESCQKALEFVQAQSGITVDKL